ncbi:hypothetical protein RB195_007509 [Necator americanus]|uniref:Endonuclease/exonuclease/phosphatase domain-containing protein n=1 Tax=Necator americanus TaxID=51031 RepID=A0ABR1C0F7_NECAM
MRDRPVISIENYTVYCSDDDENKVFGCAIPVRNDYKNLVEGFGSTSSRCAFVRLRDRRGRKLWIISAHSPTGTAEDNTEHTLDNGDRLVDLCEQTGLIIASTFKKSHRRHQLTWQGSTLLTPEEQRKRKMGTFKLQLDYVPARNISQTDIRKSRAVWDVAFDSDHRPVLLSFKSSTRETEKFLFNRKSTWQV